jgi:hypothetical protein
MQSSTGFKNVIDKVAGMESVLIFDNPHMFDATDRMFYPYSKRSDLPVSGFFFLSKASSLLHRRSRYLPFTKIVKDECRLRTGNFAYRIFKTCAALHNFRIKINPCLIRILI